MVFFIAGPKKRGRSQPRGDQRRAEIIRAATALFSEQGYHRTSLADVASAVGITQAGLLHHYGSKEQLLLAVIDERLRDGDRRLLPLLARDGLDFLGGTDQMVQENVAAPAMLQLFALLQAEAIPPDHPAHDHFVVRYRRIRERARQVLEAGRTRGEIRSDLDLGAVAALIWAVMDGLQIQWLYDPEQIDFPATYRLFTTALSAWLSVPKEAAEAPESVPTAQ